MLGKIKYVTFLQNCSESTLYAEFSTCLSDHRTPPTAVLTSGHTVGNALEPAGAILWESIVKFLEILQTGTCHIALKLDHSGCVYSMEIAKCFKSGLSPPEQRSLKSHQHTSDTGILKIIALKIVDYRDHGGSRGGTEEGKNGTNFSDSWKGAGSA